MKRGEAKKKPSRKEGMCLKVTKESQECNQSLWPHLPLRTKNIFFILAGKLAGKQCFVLFVYSQNVALRGKLPRLYFVARFFVLLG